MLVKEKAWYAERVRSVANKHVILESGVKRSKTNIYKIQPPEDMKIGDIVGFYTGQSEPITPVQVVSVAQNSIHACMNNKEIKVSKKDLCHIPVSETAQQTEDQTDFQKTSKKINFLEAILERMKVEYFELHKIHSNSKSKTLSEQLLQNKNYEESLNNLRQVQKQLEDSIAEKDGEIAQLKSKIVKLQVIWVDPIMFAPILNASTVIFWQGRVNICKIMEAKR